MKYEAIVIGVSTGGLNALRILLPALPVDFKLPVIIVQHVASTSEGYWIKAMNDICPLKVMEADEKENIRKGNVYIAPPNYHLLIENDRTFSLSADERVNFARPSIDVLFESAARIYKNKLIGIVLTGLNSDGTKGLEKIKESGGWTIVQDPVSAESPNMPASAIANGKADHILPLESIVDLLLAIPFS